MGPWSRYTFREAVEALEYNASRYLGPSADHSQKVHELISKWIHRDFRVRDEALKKRFIVDVVEGKIIASPMTKELLFGAMLEGRIEVKDPALLQAAATSLLTLGIPLRAPIARLMNQYFEGQWMKMVAPAVPSLTKFPVETESRVYQPVGDTFFKAHASGSGLRAYQEFVVGPTSEAVGVVGAYNLCQWRTMVVHYIKSLFPGYTSSTVFVPFPLDVILTRNHFLFRDKREMSELGAESLVRHYLEDPTIRLIVIPMTLRNVEGPRHYRILHHILSSVRFPGVPAYGSTPGANHVNALILDKTTRKFKLFEPHLRRVGDPSKDKDIEEKENHFEFVRLWAKGLGYEPEAYICADTPGEKGVQGIDGLCASWSVLFMALQMMNSQLPEADLRQAMSFSTLTWFMFFLYATMPNLLHPCKSVLRLSHRDKDGHPFQTAARLDWPRNKTLARALARSPSETHRLDYSGLTTMPPRENPKLTTPDQPTPSYYVPPPPDSAGKEGGIPRG
jgi:hypothetical protein